MHPNAVREAGQAPALLHLPFEHVPPLQSELELQCPQVLFEHVPTEQSDELLQWPHVPLEQVPLPLQSELELQPPHLLFEHVPVLQSELELQWLQVPFEQVPWPLQSDELLQWPHVLFEHVPKPAQSELELQYGSAAGRSTPAGESAVIVSASFVLSAWTSGTGTRATVGLASVLPQAAIRAMRRSAFMRP